MDEGSGVRVEALLARLVRQFSSPYDFLRELVQNAMDGGSDLVEVRLTTHPGDADGEVVFELSVIDAGEGMDEAIIDGELTKLFASSKRDDRTMAGGFGIGFVSVFAWEPSSVILQTGRRDESWELVFDQRRRFEKRRVDTPLEGTTVRLFRDGRLQEREAVAEAVRDALWRWCRYVPIEVTFEDEASGAGVEVICDAPVPEDAVVLRELSPGGEGETIIKVAFAVPPHAVLLRHGLVLAEGSPKSLLPHAAKELGQTLRHLRVWADSPRLRTSMARDKVIDDAGRESIDRDVHGLVEQMRDELVERIQTIAVTPSAWDDRTHEQYAYLHAHLALEVHARPKACVQRPLLRSPAGTAVSVAGLQTRARARLVAGVAVGPPSVQEAALRVAAGQCGVPMIVTRWDDDEGWLQPLVGRRGLTVVPLRRAVTRLEPRGGLADALAAMITTLLRQTDSDTGDIGFATFVDVRSPPIPLVAVEGASGVAVIGGPLHSSWTARRRVWVNAGHPMVERAIVGYAARPLFMAYLMATAVGGRLDNEKIGAERLTEAVASLSR